MRFIDSFKLDKEYARNLAIDAAALAILALLLLGYGSIMKTKTEQMTNGQDPEIFKQQLLSISPEEAQDFVKNVQQFVVLFVLGLILIVAASLGIFSYSRQLIWQKRFNKKQFWKWNALTLLLMVFTILYLAFYFIVRVVVNLLLRIQDQSLFFALQTTLSAIFLMAFLFFVFRLFKTFSQRRKVWESLGETFSSIKRDWNILWKKYLLAAVVGAGISVLLTMAEKEFYYKGPIFNLVLSLAVFVIFFGWVRRYVS
jgi:hypothetical protein